MSVISVVGSFGTIVALFALAYQICRDIYMQKSHYNISVNCMIFFIGNGTPHPLKQYRVTLRNIGNRAIVINYIVFQRKNSNKEPLKNNIVNVTLNPNEVYYIDLLDPKEKFDFIQVVDSENRFFRSDEVKQ